MPPLQSAPLDSATLNAVLQKQGMPNTTENLNRIAQFHAVAPDLLAQYLGQGTDTAIQGAANGGTNGAIDRSIAQTDPRLAALAGPNPLSSSVDPNTGASNIGPGLVRDSGNGNGGPRGRVTVGQPTKAGPSPSRQGNYGDATTPRAQASMPSDPVTMGSTGYTGGGDPRDPGTGATDKWGIGDYVMLSILGPAAYAAWRASQGKPPQQLPGGPPVTPQVGSQQIPPSRQLPAPQKQLTGPPDNSGAPPPTPPKEARAPGQPMAPGPGQTAADVARMQAEVDASNAADAAKLQEQMKTKAAQENTRKTLEAGKRVFTGGRK